MEFTLTFLSVFAASIVLVSPLLIFLSIVVISLGQVVAYFEKWERFNALYWSLITATTVGYGDIRPLKKVSRIISVLIAITGIMFSGILVALTLESVRVAFELHVDPAEIESLREKIL